MFGTNGLSDSAGIFLAPPRQDAVEVRPSIDARLDQDYQALMARHEALQKEVEYEKRRTFHIGRKRWGAGIASIAAIFMWAVSLGNSLGLAISKDEHVLLKAKTPVKLLTMGTTALMWFFWDRYHSALEKRAEFEEKYIEQAEEIERPKDLEDKRADYQQAIKRGELDGYRAAEYITDILQLHSQLDPIAARHYPPRDRLLAELVYMLPKGNSIRQDYMELHRRVVETCVQEGLGESALSVPLADVDEASTPPHLGARVKLGSGSYGTVYEMPDFQGAGACRRQEAYGNFCRNWLKGMQIDATFMGDEKACRWGAVESDDEGSGVSDLSAAE